MLELHIQRLGVLDELNVLRVIPYLNRALDESININKFKPRLKICDNQQKNDYRGIKMAMGYIKMFYDWVDKAADLTDEEFGSLMRALVSYARDGKSVTPIGGAKYLLTVFSCKSVDASLLG